jgi:hypothetical protein
LGALLRIFPRRAAAYIHAQSLVVRNGPSLECRIAKSHREIGLIKGTDDVSLTIARGCECIDEQCEWNWERCFAMSVGYELKMIATFYAVVPVTR